MRYLLRRVVSNSLVVVLVLTMMFPYAVFGQTQNGISDSDKKYDAVLYAGETFSIPEGGKIKYTSCDKKVAKVGKKGKVTAKKPGIVEIKAGDSSAPSYIILVKESEINIGTDFWSEKGSSEVIELKGGSLKKIASSNTDIVTVAKVRKGKTSLTTEGLGNATLTIVGKPKYGKKQKYSVNVHVANLYTVNFDSDGGSSVESQKVFDGRTAVKPADPTKGGFVFGGWCSDKAHINKYDFSSAVTQDTTLYADWVVSVDTMPEDGKSDEPSVPDDPAPEDDKPNVPAPEDDKPNVPAPEDGKGNSDVVTPADDVLQQIQVGFQPGDTQYRVTKNVTLPKSIDGYEGVSISWSSDSPEIISDEGAVERPFGEDATVLLTATISFASGNVSGSREFKLDVARLNNASNPDIEERTVTDIRGIGNDELDIAFNEDESAVTSITGKFSDVVVEDEEDALDVLQSIHNMLGLSSAYEELEACNSHSDDNGASYSFVQKSNGFYVYGTGVTVVVDEEGKTEGLSSGLVDSSTLKNFDISPSYSQEEAEEAALDYFDNAILDEYCMTEPMIYTLGKFSDSPVIAYRVFVLCENVSYIVFVNSSDCSVICAFPGTTGLNATAEDELGNKPTFPVKHVSGPMGSTSIQNYFLHDETLNVQAYERGTNSLIWSLDDPIKNSTNTWTDKQQVSAYENTRKIVSWWDSAFSRDSLDDHGMKVNVVVHDSSRVNNACWDPSHSRIYVGSSSANDWNVNNYSMAAAKDILTHESGHAVLQYDAGYDFTSHYSNTSGAINEGYADIFGCLIEKNWQIGESMFTSASKWGNRHVICTRDVANPGNSLAKTMGPDKMSDSKYVSPVSTPNVSNDYGGVHTNNYLVSHAAYLMNNAGMSFDTLGKLWYKSMSEGYSVKGAEEDGYKIVRRNVIKAAEHLGLSDPEKVIIRKAFDDEEIFDEVGALSFNFTGVSGNKIDTIGAAVKIVVENPDASVPNPKKELSVSDLSNVKIENVYRGDNAISIDIPGYVNYAGRYTVETDKTGNIDVVLLADGSGKAGGVITSATTGLAVPSVSLTVYSGHNTYSGNSVVEGTTDGDGVYLFDLPAGYYTLKATKTDYSEAYKNIVVSGGTELLNQNASISPVMNLSSDYRVVLTWGENPSDLDSHLTASVWDKYSYHVYYMCKNGYDENGDVVANLDVDDTSSYGPETTTFSVTPNGEYEYYINWFTGDGTWATSEAKVEVYNGDSLIYVMNVPGWTTGSGNWKVFSIKNGIFKKYDY